MYKDLEKMRLFVSDRSEICKSSNLFDVYNFSRNHNQREVVFLTKDLKPISMWKVQEAVSLLLLASQLNIMNSK